jgi:hypothetical protein
MDQKQRDRLVVQRKRLSDRYADDWLERQSPDRARLPVDLWDEIRKAYVDGHRAAVKELEE